MTVTVHKWLNMLMPWHSQALMSKCDTFSLRAATELNNSSIQLH